ncbi:hypothetical protein E2C01_013825 [Portunus trituberculatus]|uniref:Uncharacterized protein n=1 Tax=Portunus trituberculatus TaxID=210409 RepID=A0A5B7DH90_PORTR|nr:hypothetical protein [Portunus trituberculatus]
MVDNTERSPTNITVWGISPLAGKPSHSTTLPDMAHSTEYPPNTITPWKSTCSAVSREAVIALLVHVLQKLVRLTAQCSTFGERSLYFCIVNEINMPYFGKTLVELLRSTPFKTKQY